MFKENKRFAGMFLKESGQHNPGDDVDPTLIIRKSGGGISLAKTPGSKMVMLSVSQGSNHAIQSLTAEDIKKLIEFLK